MQLGRTVAEDLQATARAFAAALPASVEMPAGTGKTELLAATVHEVATAGGRILVLTHTNAGVHAIKSRLKRFGSAIGYRVATITSFAFTLARAYAQLGQMAVPAVPYWSDSEKYIIAAARVSGSHHIRRVLAASFTHLLVDEYQDCSRAQHDFICTLAELIPSTGVLGDRLQAIFGFADPLIAWNEVETRFPNHLVPIEPWRWKGHNDALGTWLLDARDLLIPGQDIHLVPQNLPAGITFMTSTGDWRSLQDAASRTGRPDETVLVITGPGRNQARAAASRLHGKFSAMEEISGGFMNDQLTKLAAAAPTGYATWLAKLIKDCCTPHGDINRPVLNRLAKGEPVAKLKRPGLEETLHALDHVLADKSLDSVTAAMDLVIRAPTPRLHSHEAWFDIQAAIRGAIAGERDPGLLTAELAKARDRIRHSGRSHRRRIVSRTVLVKGLEYDHVIIANVSQIRDAHNLYVALTRARKSIAIIGNSPTLTITDTPLEPKARARARSR